MDEMVKTGDADASAAGRAIIKHDSKEAATDCMKVKVFKVGRFDRFGVPPLLTVDA
jgi:hypothetical protein